MRTFQRFLLASLVPFAAVSPSFGNSLGDSSGSHSAESTSVALEWLVEGMFVGQDGFKGLTAPTPTPTETPTATPTSTPGPDGDGDGVPDAQDNCPEDFNPGQEDTDADGKGDVCDVCPGFDDSLDGDADEVPDGCDNCPSVPDLVRLEDTVALLIAGQEGLIGLIPDRYEFSEGETGTSIPDGGSDMFDGGNILNTNLASDPIQYTSGEVRSSDLQFGPGSSYFTLKLPGLFALRTAKMAIGSFSITGGASDNGAMIDSATLQVSVKGDSYTVFVKRIFGIADPSINHLILVPGDGAGIRHTFSANPNDDLDQLDSLVGIESFSYLLVARQNGLRLTDADAIRIAEAFLNLTAVGQTDTDNDGVGDACDNCLSVVNADQFDNDGDGSGDACDLCPGFDDNLDGEGDGVPNGCDNCPVASNPGQEDSDSDGTGDVCDPDIDGDGVHNGADNCTLVANEGQENVDRDIHGDECDTCPGYNDALDQDSDGVPDDCDNCPSVANSDQADTDHDESGDECDLCPGSDDTDDVDSDGVPDGCDNCSTVFNPVGEAFDLPVALGRLSNNFQAITSLIPDRHDFSDGQSGTSISDGGSDMFDTGNFLNTNLAAEIPYTSGLILPSDAFGPASSYYTVKFPGLFAMTAANMSIDSFFLSGGAGDSGAQIDNATFQLTLKGDPFTVFVKRIFGSADPSINHLLIVPGEGAGITHPFSANPNDDLDRLDGLAGIQYLSYLLVSRLNGQRLEDSDAVLIAEQFIRTHLPAQLDSDGDGVGDECDNCPSSRNPDQLDSDTDGEGDVCDVCPEFDNGLDGDGDGVPDGCDNCLSDSNPYEGPSTLEETLTLLTSNHESITSLIPNRFDFADGDSGTSIGDGGSDMFDGGNSLNSNLASAILYTGGSISRSDAAFGSGSSYFTAKFPGLFALVTKDMDIDAFSISGGSGDSGAVVEGAIFPLSVNGNAFTVYLKRTFGAGDPSINHLLMIPGDGSGVSHSFATDPNDDFDSLVGLAGIDSLFYVLVSRAGGLGLSDADAIEIAEAFLRLASFGQPDADNDGLGDACDNCLFVANLDQIDGDGDGSGDLCDLCPGSNDSVDADSDGVPDDCDNCPSESNSGQEDADNDEIGDVCDPDEDGDGFPNDLDNCPFAFNPGQEDTDGDGFGDACRGGYVLVSCDDADDHCGGTGCMMFYPRTLTLFVTESKSPGQGILAIGVNSGRASDALENWNDPLNGGPGATIHHVTDLSKIATIDFSHFALLYIPSSGSETSGGITVEQAEALNARKDDIVHFVNNLNGSLIGLVQSALPNPWRWLPQSLQAVNSDAGPVYPTAAFTLPGSGFCPECAGLELTVPFTHFHCFFTGPSGYSGLSVLARRVEGNQEPVMLGGIVTLSSELCDNAIDDDGDGLADCEDTECRMAEHCFESTCFDGQDNDGDDLVDCGDRDCAGDTISKCVGCDSGYYILDSLGGRHRVGTPPLITGPVYFGADVARDMERVAAVGHEDNSTGGLDLAVLDGFGVVHFVAETDATIPVDFYFQGTNEFPSGRAVDVVVSFDNLGLWVLTDFGGIFRAGTAKAPNDPAQVPGDASLLPLGVDVPYGDLRDPGLPNPGGASLRAVSLVVLDLERDSRADGYIVVDSQGGRFHLQPNGAPFLAGSFGGFPDNHPFRLLDPTGYMWPFFRGLDIARDAELHRSGIGLIVLDGWDGIHPVPVNLENNPVYFSTNRISNDDPTPVSMVGLPYIVRGFDDPSTGADEGDPATYGADAAAIFADLEFSNCGDGLYTMDRFGAVFALGGARVDPMEVAAPFSNTPYFFPFLYAEDMEVFAGNELGPETDFSADGDDDDDGRDDDDDDGGF